VQKRCTPRLARMTGAEDMIENELQRPWFQDAQDDLGEQGCKRAGYQDSVFPE
jgi:hypothetical protein